MDNKTLIIIIGIIVIITVLWVTFIGKQLSQPSGFLGLIGSSQEGSFSGWNTTALNNTDADETVQNKTIPAANKTAADDANKDLVCEYPYTLIGSSCCVDFNSNNFCDVGEAKVEPHHSSSCSAPYTMANDFCCLDQNSNNLCDSNETGNLTCNETQLHTDSGCCPDDNRDGVCDNDATACELPYLMIGLDCCVDFNSNGMCDEKETTITPPDSGECLKPLEMIGAVCCLDLIDDGICDNETDAGYFFDAHAHIASGVPLGQVIAMMDKLHVKRMVLMEPPATTSQDASSEYWIPEAAEQYPEKFIVLYGGEAKAMLEANADSEPSEDDTKAFADLLKAAIESKKYRGFGEIGLRHFGHGEGEEGGDLTIPGNHPWMFILSDTAAKYQVPIDVHMEATEDTVAGLEELLYHNENTIIIWDHAGWSNTGLATSKMLGGLMGKHPNLYASIKLRNPKTPEMAAVSIMDGNGTISQEWLRLFNDYPDRFMIGTDVKLGFGSNDNASEMFEVHQKLMEQLPEDIVKKIGMDNSMAVFGKK